MLQKRAAELDASSLVKRFKAKVLVVEDIEINLQVAKKILEAMGCEVYSAVNGRQALERLKTADYDLIFMDCQMPEMDGYQATQEIRKVERQTQTHIPVIALTAHAMQSDKQKCLDSGMDDYMTKPIRVDVLESLLAEWLPEKCVLTPDGMEGLRHSLDGNILGEIFNPPNEENIKSLDEFIQMFVKSAAEHLSTMKLGVDAKDYDKVHRAAHSLKGASGNIGAAGMMELCRSLEDKAKKKNLDKASEDCAQLESEFKRTSGELKSFFIKFSQSAFPGHDRDRK